MEDPLVVGMSGSTLSISDVFSNSVEDLGASSVLVALSFDVQEYYITTPLRNEFSSYLLSFLPSSPQHLEVNWISYKEQTQPSTG